MGARASVSFKDTSNEESITVFSHWGGREFQKNAIKYVEKLKKDIEERKISPTYPLGRLEASTVVIDFIRHITKDEKRIESDLYLGKNKNDGDNSDFGHKTIMLKKEEEEEEEEEKTTTPEKMREAFKKRYAKAVKEGEEIFIFQKQEVLTQYGKYIIKFWKDFKIGE